MKKKQNKNTFPEFNYLQYNFEVSINCFAIKHILIAEISNFYPQTTTLYISPEDTVSNREDWRKLEMKEVDRQILDHVKIFIGIIERYGFVKHSFIAQKNNEKLSENRK